MRTVPAGARHHHSSPGPGNSTGPRVPPGFFSLPAWEASQCRDSAGEILSSVGSRDGPAERLRQGHSCGSGRHQMFPRQLAEAEPCSGVGHTVPFAVGPWSKGGQGWWSPKSHQATRKPQVMPQEFHPCRWWESRFPASYHIATLTQTFLFAERVCHSSVLDPSALWAPVPKQSQAFQRDTVHTASIVWWALVKPPCKATSSSGVHLEKRRAQGDLRAPSRA